MSQSPLPVTEQENARSARLDQLSAAEIAQLMNEEDALVARAVGAVLPQVALAIEKIVERMRGGGRLFYVGTGTSGRLGVLDAAECPPTFGVSPDLIQGVIAGGYDACYRAVEASEDDRAAGERDLAARGLKAGDAVLGLAASGRTPYTIGAVRFARGLGCLTVAVTCVPDSALTEEAGISIVPVVGPEIVTGSTRLKAGTAQKMVLNMISTAAMVKLGYVVGNRMTNLNARNDKLRERAVRVIAADARVGEDEARRAFHAAGEDARIALVMIAAGVAREGAAAALAAEEWVVKKAIDRLRKAAT